MVAGVRSSWDPFGVIGGVIWEVQRLLEAAADERWGGQEDYEEYKRATSVLVIRPPARSA